METTTTTTEELPAKWEEKPLSLRDKLLKTCVRRYTRRDVDGIGSVRVQSLTELERATVEVVASQDAKKMRAMLIVQSLVDDDGNRLFSDKEVDSVLQMDSRISMALSDVVLDHIGRDKSEDAVKN